jgi:hypothetical protein
MASFGFKNKLVLGKFTKYFIFNETLYELNIKTGAAYQHPEFSGKKIVKVIGGKHHFMAYERTQ